MRWILVGLGMRLLGLPLAKHPEPCEGHPPPFPPPGRRVPLAENAAVPLIYTEEAWLKEDRLWAAVAPLPGGSKIP